MAYTAPALTDVTCVFDEPSIGLHAHDVERMNGPIVFEGPVSGLAAADTATATGRHLDVRLDLKLAPWTPTGSIPIRNARAHNLQDVSVDVPGNAAETQ